MRSVGRVLAGLAFAFAVMVPSVAWAAPAGSLDTTFDTDGMQTVSTTAGSESGSEVLLVGGKILVYGASDGDLMITRLTTSGAPDPSFGGGDGIVTMNVLGAEQNYGDFAVVGGGKIVAAVPTAPPGGHGRLGVVRLTSAGHPDPSFGGGDGKLAVDFGKEFDPYAMVALPNGKLLVSGEFYRTMADSEFLVARLLPKGTLDHSFGGGDGFVTTQFGSHNDGAWRMAVDTQGRIVADGWAGESATNYDLGVARYTPNGAPDHSFSGDGKVRLQVLEGSDDYAYGLALAGDKVIAGLHVENGSALQVGLARFLPSGALDPSFGGGDGEVLLPSGAPGLDLKDIGADAAGRVVALVGTGSPKQLELVRFLPSGKLDRRFGADGFSDPTSFPNDALPESVAIGGQGNIVAVGGSEGDVVVARWVG